MNKTLTAIMSALVTAMPASAIIYTPVHNTDTYNYGFNKKEAFDVAIHIADVNLEGAKITGIRVPVVAEAQVNDKGYTLWLSTDLNLRANTFTPDVASQKAEVSDGWAVVTFDTPVSIPEGGIYAGYSFALRTMDTDADATPLVLGTAPIGENNMWIHTSHTYRSWQNFGTDVDASAPVQVIIDDDAVSDYAASVSVNEQLYCEIGNIDALNVDVINNGKQPISEIAYTLSVSASDSQVDEYKGIVRFDTPISAAYYGEKRTVNIPFPKYDDETVVNCAIEYTEVNGMANTARCSRDEFSMAVLPFVPKHRPLVEEYTGLWCGYCPSGYVGLKMLADHIKDDVVIVSVHNQDPMEVLPGADYPYAIEGFPEMWFDRKASTDPFFGDNINNMYGLDNVWRKIAGEFVDCAIDITAAYDDESCNAVTARATVKFLNEHADADYRVGFCLTADDLYHPGWKQTNYYSFGNVIMPIEMEQFTKGEEKVSGLHFDDVLVAYSDLKGIPGSLPAQIEKVKAYDVDYKFDISANKVIQDKKKVKAIAFVVDGATGRVVNSISVPLSAEGAGIALPGSVEKTVMSIDYYDLQGIKHTAPQQGVNVKVIRYTDGTIQTSKIYNRLK